MNYGRTIRIYLADGIAGDKKDSPIGQINEVSWRILCPGVCHRFVSR